ncbi:alpha-hydroxy-acid oxidizing protein, partial [Corynebacterium argentoratense]|uniref:alpha-hydroxy-acid oxidizing protein n=1 Tax=Corynebacterium argentoratense TaxID=42817 RepID=UPI003C6FFA2F
MENDRDKAHELVRRAQASGYDTLMVTVDTAVAGSRHRDMRSGMTFPPKLTWKTFADASYKVEWWSSFLTTEPLTVTNFGEGSQSFQEIGTMFDPTLNFTDLATYITHWNTPRRQVKLKGLTPAEY